MLRTVQTPAEVRAFTAGLVGKRLALVPTMGFLHAGHQALICEGARRADAVAVSIFVNPTQFGPNEDLARYPRDLAGDLKKCAEAGATLVYAPQPPDVYPPGYQTYVQVEQVSRGLDGEKRPGHFRGVATVVTKLLALFRPHVALFGEKDYQQLQVIRALNADLELGAEIVGCPTVREADGLAMSSRNQYLEPAERERAPLIHAALQRVVPRIAAGDADLAALEREGAESLARAGFRVDYFSVRRAEDLLAPGPGDRDLVVLAAARLGRARLIDNLRASR